MDTKKLLEQIGKLFESNTTHLRKEIRESEERLTNKLKEEIKKSQFETIETLTELMHEGYNNHEERIEKIEKHLHIPQS